MADEIDADLAQLRAEIARFVLDAIRQDPQGDVAQAMGRALNEQVSASINQNLPTLVSRAVADGFDRSLPQLREAAAAANAGAASGPIMGIEAARQRYEAPTGRNDPWAWARGTRGIAFIVAAVALFAAVVLAVLFLMQPRGGTGTRTDRPVEDTQTVQDDGTASVDAELGWGRILDQVNTWAPPERRAALDALCGPNVSRAQCPTYDTRRFVLQDRATRQAAALAAGRAMTELGYCTRPDTGTGDAAANAATNSAARDAPTAPAADAVWDCLVYGAARG